MTQVDSAKDFFDIHVPEHVKALCDFSSLALTNFSFIRCSLFGVNNSR
ncbi:Rpn family recombination-promoting nuclease/putative transposase [Providencia alcalifaciens]